MKTQINSFESSNLERRKENYELIVSLSKFFDSPCYSNEKCMIKNWSLQKKTKVLNFIVNQCSIPHMFCLSVSILLYSQSLLSFHVFFIFEIFGHCNVLCNSGSSNINYYDLGLAEDIHINKKVKHPQETTIFIIVRPTPCLRPQAMPTKNIQY